MVFLLLFFWVLVKEYATTFNMMKYEFNGEILLNQKNDLSVIFWIS
jgi:hypothetical protein